ncbi:opacity protein-like surface antigen [Nitrobacteraceae bacterium AZCC 1564]
MKELLLVPFALMMAASPLSAADLTVKAQQPLSSGWGWTGLYIGAHAGAMWGRTNFSDPFGPSIFGDTVRTPGYLFGGQIGYNWQQGASPWVLGVEADISALDSDGTFTCFAFSGIFISANCRVRPHALGTLTGRVGYMVGSDHRTLLYAKGGAAWTRDTIDITSNNQFNSGATISTTADQTKWGWTAGAGVERALTPAWSLMLEYNYAQFGDVNIATPASQTVTSGGAATPIPGNVSSATQHIHLAKVGLNYRWGEDPMAGWGNVVSPALPVKAPLHAAARTAGWEIEGGTRYWYSSDRLQWDNAGAVGGLVQSRLTYDDRTTHAGELFGRIDSPWGMFVKGFIGGGATVNGHMNDEDWGIDDGPRQPIHILYKYSARQGRRQRRLRNHRHRSLVASGCGLQIRHVCRLQLFSRKDGRLRLRPDREPDESRRSMRTGQSVLSTGPDNRGCDHHAEGRVAVNASRHRW